MRNLNIYRCRLLDTFHQVHWICAIHISLRSFLNHAHAEIFCQKKEEIVTCQRLNGTTTRKMTKTIHGIFFDKYNEGITSVNKFSLGYSRNSHAKYESLTFLMLTVVTNSLVSFISTTYHCVGLNKGNTHTERFSDSQQP